MKKLILTLVLITAFSVNSFAQFIGVRIGIPTLQNNSTPWNPTPTNPPNIATNYAGWIAWKNFRMQQFQRHCPLNRATTYYFSNSGNDSLGDGSIGNPWATRAKAKTVVAASSGDIRCRFKRGDIFREDVDWIITKNVTVDDYGTGNLPLITEATATYPAGSLWTLDSGNSYKLTEVRDIAWVLVSNDRLGELRGQTLSWQDSIAHVRSVANSFFWNSGTNTLYVNLNGTNPNTLDLEAIVSNNNNGVAFSGDGGRVQNIIAMGFGLNRTQAATQTQPFTSYATGTNANYFNQVEAYYSGTHVVAMYNSSTGGHAMFNNVIAGYGQADGGGSLSVYNLFSDSGGHEGWVLNSTVKYGGLPSYLWSFATLKKQGTGFYGHTVTGLGALTVVDNVTVSASIQPVSSIGNFNNMPTSSGDITQVRSFIVNTTRPAAGYTAPDTIAINNDTVYYAVQDYNQMVDGGTASLASGTQPSNFWLINSYLDLNATAFTGGNLGLTNFSPGPLNIKMYIWNSQIKWRNVISTTSLSVDIFTCFNSNALPDAAADMRNSTLINSIYSHNQSTAGYYVGMYNDATHLVSNAYYNVTQSSNTVRGYNNDAGATTPGSEPVLGVSQSAFLLHGSNTLRLSNDLNGKIRTASPPDQGPVDFSSPSNYTLDISPNG